MKMFKPSPESLPKLPTLKTKKNDHADRRLEKQDFIKQSELVKVAKEIKKKMEEEKLFTQCRLSLRDLAPEIGVKSYLISKSVNQVYKKSFITLINEYRVMEVIRLMNTPKAKTHSLLGLAFEAGFNSKTSFHNQFKEITGQTPKEYSRNILLIPQDQ